MLNILQWNCTAITTAQDLSTQHLSRNQYEVLALQSLITTYKRLPELPGYHYPPFLVQDNNRGIRAATYILQGLSARRGTIPSPWIEGHQLAMVIQTKEDQEVNILNVYNPRHTHDFSWLADVPDNWVVVSNFNSRDMSWDKDYPISSDTIAEQLSKADVILLNDGSLTRIPDSSNQIITAVDLSFVSSNIAAICCENRL